MPSPERRATGRRRAWGRGPIILKLESLEGRALLAARAGNLPDLVNSALTVSSNVSDWGNSVEVEGRVTNQGSAATTAPLQVGLYASAVRGINKYSVPIGQVTIPAGLGPRQPGPYHAPHPAPRRRRGPPCRAAPAPPAPRPPRAPHAHHPRPPPAVRRRPGPEPAAAALQPGGDHPRRLRPDHDVGQHGHGHGPGHQQG